MVKANKIEEPFRNNLVFLQAFTVGLYSFFQGSVFRELIGFGIFSGLGFRMLFRVLGCWDVGL